MVDKRLVWRRDGYNVRSITLVTVGRVNCQAGQHRAQEPCDEVGSACDGTIHVRTIKLRGPNYQRFREEGLREFHTDFGWRLYRDPVPVAFWLAGDEEAGGGCASVDGLVLQAGGDFESFAGMEDDVAMFDFEG